MKSSTKLRRFFRQPAFGSGYAWLGIQGGAIVAILTALRFLPIRPLTTEHAP